MERTRWMRSIGTGAAWRPRLSILWHRGGHVFSFFLYKIVDLLTLAASLGTHPYEKRGADKKAFLMDTLKEALVEQTRLIALVVRRALCNILTLAFSAGLSRSSGSLFS